ncbi:hypothetical protein [Streptomyces sp. NPDC001275]
MTTSNARPQSRSPAPYTAREIEEPTGIKAATIRVERRCATDGPDRSRESLRAPYAQPWK